MPYIEASKRKAVDTSLIRPATAGELNYQISTVIKSYWTHGPRNYQSINDIVGALEGAKTEFQRQIVNPYEDKKIRDNGPLYE